MPKAYLPPEGSAARRVVIYLHDHPLGTEFCTHDLLAVVEVSKENLASNLRACLKYGIVARRKLSDRLVMWRLLREVPELFEEQDDPLRLEYRIGRNIPGEELCRAWGVGR